MPIRNGGQRCNRAYAIYPKFQHPQLRRISRLAS